MSISTTYSIFIVSYFNNIYNVYYDCSRAGIKQFDQNRGIGEYTRCSLKSGLLAPTDLPLGGVGPPHSNTIIRHVLDVLEARCEKRAARDGRLSCR